MLNSQQYRRRSDPGHGYGHGNYYGGHVVKRPLPSGGYGYGQNMGYNYEAGPGYTKVGGGEFYDSSFALGSGRGRAPAPDRNSGRLDGPGAFGNSGYSRSAGRNGGDGYQARTGGGRGFPNQERGWGRGGEGGGYRGGHRGGPPGPGYGRGRGWDGGLGGRGRVKDGEGRGLGGQRGQSARGQGRGSMRGRGRGGGGGHFVRETVKFNCVVKIEKLPLGMGVREVRNLLVDIGFDPKLFVAKIMNNENHKGAVVKIVEDAPTFISKIDELEINGNRVECSLLDEMEISKLQIGEKSSARTHSGFYVGFQFSRFDVLPTQDEIVKKIIQGGLKAPEKWLNSGPTRFSMIIAEELDQKDKVITALKHLEFGESIAVNVKESNKTSFFIKVFREVPSIRLTNLPLDCDEKKLRDAIKRNLMFEIEIKECRDGGAEIFYTAKEMDLVDKLDGMKIGENVVKVVKEKSVGDFVVPEDWTEDKVKEILDIEKLVPLEIKVKDEKLALLFKPTKENLPAIIQELTKLRPQQVEQVEGEEAKADDEKMEESKEASREKEEAPQMIDDNPEVLASFDIENQVEEAKKDDICDIKVMGVKND